MYNLTINNRYIKNNEIIKTIVEAYHTFLPKERYPYVVLNIEVDPFLVDVNVHPTKMEAKFSKLDNLLNLIYENIKNNLFQKSLIPKAVSDNIEDNYYEETSNNNFEVNEKFV